MSEFNFSDKDSEDYSADCDPATYEKFEVEDIDYYIHIFKNAANSGDTISVHCTRCAELTAMLQQFRNIKLNNKYGKI